jgi:CRP-like cAMP-binding protein
VQENDWTSDYESYLNGKDATMNIEALEDVEAFQISYPDNEILLKTYPKFEKCYRVYFQKSYSELQQRLFESLTKTVEQRYEDFLERHFDLSQRIPQHQIAAFLGVSPEFLSKIRQRRQSH